MSENITGIEEEVVLREVFQGDLPIFFEQQLDQEANYMAAFTYRDPFDRVEILLIARHLMLTGVKSWQIRMWLTERFFIKVR